MSYYECNCSDPRGHKYSNVNTGRVLRICDDCKGWRYEGWGASKARPVISRPQMPIDTAKRKHKRLLLSA